MTLAEIWFVAIAILWIGFFVLEGFDFGVGMLLPVLGKKEEDRRVMINTIGPVWDGNEVWLLTAGGAMFAAFPEWYATVFSGLYIPLFLVLLGLIVRGVSFEYRHKHDRDDWRKLFDSFIIFGSIVVPLVLGVGFANFVRGLPIIADPAQRNWVMDGTFANILGLFNPFALVGGLTFLAVFMFHGALFIALKTKGDIRERARSFAAKVGIAAIVLIAALTIWMTVAFGKGVISWILALLAIAGVGLGLFMNNKGREGWAFIGTVVSILTTVAGMFIAMWPNVVPALTPGNDLSLYDAASTSYTLTIMTVATAIFLPMVLGYQAWTFWVFRKRISTKNLPTASAVH
ncbi:cytochrome d ubiquinol oxidase subunit II [Granulicoccus sp. GXG6511]|uniref:cytochrome d ubiquinol oxidase subunit II n=1 Tax=Granulicoccus sp. GXG6511 TaxID=3381351 RepID=UPI003D7D0B93